MALVAFSLSAIEQNLIYPSPNIQNTVLKDETTKMVQKMKQEGIQASPPQIASPRGIVGQKINSQGSRLTFQPYC